MTAGLVTVVIPTFNRGPDVLRALDHLAAQEGAPLQAIVIDNSSSDGTAEMVASRQPAWGGRLRCVRKDPQGPASARQLGTLSAETPYVLYHDSDVELAPRWVAQALARMESEPALGAVGGRIVYAFDPSRVNAYGGELNWFGLAWDVDEGRPMPSGPAEAERAVAPTVPRVWINCSAMLARRDDVIAAGGFDETFFYGYEDTDLGWRLRILGRGVAVAPELVARHHVDPSPGGAHPDIVFHAHKNRLRMMLRNVQTRRLPWVMAGCLAYGAADLLLRGPRAPKWRALTWNWARLSSTLALRADTQSRRRAGDAGIFASGSGRWFPPTRLRGQRRRAVPAGVLADLPAGTARRSGADDRV